MHLPCLPASKAFLSVKYFLISVSNWKSKVLNFSVTSCKANINACSCTLTSFSTVVLNNPPVRNAQRKCRDCDYFIGSSFPQNNLFLSPPTCTYFRNTISHHNLSWYTCYDFNSRTYSNRSLGNMQKCNQQKDDLLQAHWQITTTTAESIEKNYNPASELLRNRKMSTKTRPFDHQSKTIYRENMRLAFDSSQL